VARYDELYTLLGESLGPVDDEEEETATAAAAAAAGVNGASPHLAAAAVKGTVSPIRVPPSDTRPMGTPPPSDSRLVRRSSSGNSGGASFESGGGSYLGGAGRLGNSPGQNTAL